MSDIVTVSDASPYGGGVCVARSLTDLGRATARAVGSTEVPASEESLIVVGVFDGIGGLRRALELIHVNPRCYLSLEIDRACVRVLSAAWPDVVQLGDARGVSTQKLLAIRQQHPRLREGLFGSSCCGLGPPLSRQGQAGSPGISPQGISTFQVLRTLFDISARCLAMCGGGVSRRLWIRPAPRTSPRSALVLTPRLMQCVRGGSHGCGVLGCFGWIGNLPAVVKREIVSRPAGSSSTRRTIRDRSTDGHPWDVPGRGQPRHRPRRHPPAALAGGDDCDSEA